MHPRGVAGAYHLDRANDPAHARVPSPREVYGDIALTLAGFLGAAVAVSALVSWLALD
jgi:hypothetical protein